MINSKYSNDRVEECQRLFRLREKINDDVINAEWPEFKVSNSIREAVKTNPRVALGCDARIRMGKFYTDEEYEEHKKKSLKRQLP